MTPVYIIGCGGHARVISNIFKLQQTPILGYYDDKNSNVVGTIQDILMHEKNKIHPLPHNYICAIGDNSSREKIVKLLEPARLSWTNAIHPAAIIATDAILGNGCVIGPGAIIQPGVTIGNHVIVNSNAVIEHDCEILDFVHVAPGATLCGSISVGCVTLVGAGAKIIPKIKIGNCVTIGAGSTVIRDIPDTKTVVGSPAKVIH
jgi:sugar O-acyltransferase (sialic acid O-acetyltransferase NeuD family)